MYIYHIVCSTSIVGGSVCYHRRHRLQQHQDPKTISLSVLNQGLTYKTVGFGWCMVE